MHEICFIICIHKILVELHATPVVSLFCAVRPNMRFGVIKRGKNKKTKHDKGCSYFTCAEMSMLCLYAGCICLTT